MSDDSVYAILRLKARIPLHQGFGPLFCLSARGGYKKLLLLKRIEDR